MKNIKSKLITVALISFLLSEILIFAKDNPRKTGLPKFTKEELKKQNKNHFRTKKVKINELGLKRINKFRENKRLKKLSINEIDFAPMGSDIESEIPSSTTQNSPSNPGSSNPIPTSLPDYIDNSTSKYFPPIRSQGYLPSCAAFSGAYYVMTYMNALAKNIDAKNGGDSTRLSPKWIYNMVNDGNQVGSWYYWAYDIGIKHGVATWSEFPYDSNYKEWNLDPNVWKNAIYRRFSNYGYVDNTNTNEGINQVKQMLVNGYILNIPTFIGSWNYKTIKNDPSTSADDAFVGKRSCYFVDGGYGYHAMTVVGYNDNIWVDINNNGKVDLGEKGAFRIANSWGNDWEDSGYCWMSYDALKSTSAVSGGPSANRVTGWYPSRAHWVRARSSYSPKILAQFTLSHAKRNQLKMSLGSSTVGSNYPYDKWNPYKVLYAAGGPYAFNGSNTSCNGTFVFDLTDLLPENGQLTRYFLKMYDTTNNNIATLKSFKIIDVTNNKEKACSNVPRTIDGSFVYSYIDFSYTNNNLPKAIINVDVSKGYAPLKVTFNASSSYDTDGSIAKYEWNFGDGTNKTGAIIQHTYNNVNIYTVKLKVTDNEGATHQTTKTITVKNLYINIPTGLTINDPGDNTLKLNWNSNSENYFKGYNIYRDGIKINNLAVGESKYTDTNLTQGQKYTYQVTLVDKANGESDKSSSISACAGKPSAVKKLKSKSAFHQAILNWTASTECDLHGYNVYQKTGEEISYEDVALKSKGAKVSGNTLINGDAAINQWSGSSDYASINLNQGMIFDLGKEYKIRKFAISLLIYNYYSDYYKFQIFLSKDGQNYNLVAHKDNDTTGGSFLQFSIEPQNARYVKLVGNFTNISNNKFNVEEFYVYTIKEVYSKVNSSLIATNSYSVKNLNYGTIYYHLVTAKDIYGNESNSSAIVKSYPDDGLAPSKPTNISITDPANKNLTIKWDSNSEFDFNGYNIYKGSSKINTSLITSTSYTDSNLTRGIDCTYQITALDKAGNESTKSSEVSATPGRPYSPANIRANPQNEQITLLWNANTEKDIKGYNIYESPKDVALSSKGASVKLSSNIYNAEYIIDGLTNNTYATKFNSQGSITVDLGKEYLIHKIGIHFYDADDRYYRYQVYSSIDNNNFTKIIDKKTGKWAGYQEDNINATLIRYIKIKGLYCSHNTKIHIKELNAFYYKKLNTSLITSTNFTITNLKNSTKYDFLLKASDKFGNESSFSTYKYDPSHDHDNDGIPTDYELNFSLNPSLNSDANNDLDNDGLTNLEEYTLKTKPNIKDTDEDGLNDGDEVNTHNTNPLKSDSDNDGLNDYIEINTYSSNPLKTDTDNDGVSDGEEVKYNFDPTNPNDASNDADSDGLNDYEEAKAGTNPNRKDSDNDGVNDLQEILMKSNPLKTDTDGDTLTDGEEFNTYGTDPLKTDTDNDGFNDKEEVDFWTNLLDVTYDSDSDNDGTINLLDQDSDNDGYADGLEFQFNFDPLNPQNFPNTDYNTIRFTSFGYGNFDKNGGYNDFIVKDPYNGNYTFYLTDKEQVTTEIILSISSDWELLFLGDFDNTASKTTDLIWRNKATGEIAIYLAPNQNLNPENNIINDKVSLKWTLTDVNDFNGDGKNDIVFRNVKDARFCFWIMNGTQRVSMSQYGLTDKWSFEGTTDLNGDKKSDIIFRNKVDARFCFWIMNGTQRVSMSQYGLTDNWSFEGTTDINGDNKSDIIFRNKIDARFCFWSMNGQERVSMSQFNLSDKWEIVGTKDFNNDNNKDIIFRHINDGRICAWFMNGHERLNQEIITLDPHYTIKSFFDYNQDKNNDIIMIDENQNINILTMNNWSKGKEINIK